MVESSMYGVVNNIPDALFAHNYLSFLSYTVKVQATWGRLEVI